MAEGAVRVFAPHARDHALPGRLFEHDRRVGWKLKPNRKVTHRTRYFDVTYETNASGFRDRNRDDSTDRDVYRVLLYGDSLVFGWGVDVESRFSNLLERSIPSLEVWNLGIPAYGLDQQILTYELTAPAPRADEVIFFLSMDTLYRNHHQRMYGKPKPFFVKEGGGSLRAVPPASVGVSKWLYEALSPLYLPQFVNRRLTIVREGRALARERRDLDSGIPSTRGRIQDLDRDLLLLAAGTAAAKGQRVTLLAALRDDGLADLRDFRARHDVGLITVDMTRQSPDFVFGKEDRHWNAAGHRWVADRILAQVDWGVARKE